MGPPLHSSHPQRKSLERRSNQRGDCLENTHLSSIWILLSDFFQDLQKCPQATCEMSARVSYYTSVPKLFSH